MNEPIFKVFVFNEDGILVPKYRQGSAFKGPYLEPDDDGYLVKHHAPNRHERRAMWAKMTRKGPRGHINMTARDWSTIQKFKAFLREYGRRMGAQ